MRICRSSAGGTKVVVSLLVAAFLAAACGSSPSSSGGSTTTSTVHVPTPSLDPALAAQVPAKYKAAGLVVAVDPSYAPDEMVAADGHTIIGMDADLAYAIGKVLGVKMKLQQATFATIIAGLLDGKYDVGDSSFTDDKSREKQVDFVDYFSSGEGFYVPSSSSLSFTSLASLCNHTVAVESGTTEETDAWTQGKKCKVTVDSFQNQNEANLAVSSGRAQVGFLDSQVASYVVSQSNGEFKLTGKPFSTGPYGIALPKNSGLAPLFLGAFKDLAKDGVYHAILAKWGTTNGAITNFVINGATS